jgi:hypothetical protein
MTGSFHHAFIAQVPPVLVVVIAVLVPKHPVIVVQDVEHVSVAVDNLVIFEQTILQLVKGVAEHDVDDVIDGERLVCELVGDGALVGL